MERVPPEGAIGDNREFDLLNIPGYIVVSDQTIDVKRPFKRNIKSENRGWGKSLIGSIHD